MPAIVQCVSRTQRSQVLTRASEAAGMSGGPAGLLDFRFHDGERLGVEIDLHLLAVLVLAVDLVAVAVDLELLDLVALSFELGARIRFLHPLALRMRRAIRF